MGLWCLCALRTAPAVITAQVARVPRLVNRFGFGPT